MKRARCKIEKYTTYFTGDTGYGNHFEEIYEKFGAIDLLTQYEDSKPVEQRAIDESNKIAYKCDLCKDKDKLACVNACPNQALKLVTPLEDKKAKNIKAALSLLSTNK